MHHDKDEYGAKKMWIHANTSEHVLTLSEWMIGLRRW
jgi:hypothetical protein